MTKKRHAMNALIVLGIGVVLMLFIFVLVVHHHDITDRVRLNRSAQLATGSSVAERIKPVGQVSVPSAETRREPVKKAVAAPPPSRDGK